MNEDELLAQLQHIVGHRPHDGHGAVIDAVQKFAGDDLDSLVVEVRYHDARTGEKHAQCFEVAEIMADAAPDEIGWLESFIIDLDDRLTAID